MGHLVERVLGFGFYPGRAALPAVSGHRMVRKTLLAADSFSLINLQPLTLNFEP
jgi:hypothetical protein